MLRRKPGFFCFSVRSVVSNTKPHEAYGFGVLTGYRFVNCFKNLPVLHVYFQHSLHCQNNIKLWCNWQQSYCYLLQLFSWIKYKSSSGFEQERCNDHTGFRKRCYTGRQTLLACIAELSWWWEKRWISPSEICKVLTLWATKHKLLRQSWSLWRNDWCLGILLEEF